MRRLRSIAAGLVTALVTLTLLDVLVGILFLREGRFLGFFVPPYGLIFTERQAERLAADDHPYGRFDPVLGWSIHPGGVGEDGLYRANAAGFRADREYGEQAPEGIVRIATFGDSFTHGAEVGNESTWQHFLEASVPGSEVLNFGVDGYGVDQAFLRFRNDGVDYAPDIVLIGFLLENINRTVSVYRPAYYHSTAAIGVKPRFRIAADAGLELLPVPVASRADLKARVQDGSLLEVLRETDYWVRRAPLAYERSPLFWSSLFRIAYGRYENSGRNLARQYANRSGEPFQVSLEVIARFHDEALERGAQQVLVLVFPDRNDLNGALSSQPLYWQPLVDALTERGVPVLDLSAALVEAARSRDPGELFQGYHYSAAGNAVVAEAVRSRLFDTAPGRGQTPGG